MELKLPNSMQFSVIPRIPFFRGGDDGERKPTSLQGIKSAYSRQHRQSESIFGRGSYPSTYTKPRRQLLRELFFLHQLK